MAEQRPLRQARGCPGHLEGSWATEGGGGPPPLVQGASLSCQPRSDKPGLHLALPAHAWSLNAGAHTLPLGLWLHFLCQTLEIGLRSSAPLAT